MKIIYKNKSVEKQFNSAYQEKWKYDKNIKIKLIAIENFLLQASSLLDVQNYPPFHFHRLKGKRNSEWSLYVGNTGYRIVVIPCDDNEYELVDGDILAQCKYIKIIKITEVSNHYE